MSPFIDIQGGTESIELVENRIVEQRGSAKRTGIRLGAETQNITLTDNHIDGFATAIADLRKPPAAKSLISSGRGR